ncbi:hypothetical protein XENOCAPTIV_030808 [Xenoophorus captivus]|uniref:Uncharacterized protein n=1 Tax=Xenoophorus captivus TaxID=1517983 RepID=A0ABV0S6K9_9TELE
MDSGFLTLSSIFPRDVSLSAVSRLSAGRSHAEEEANSVCLTWNIDGEEKLSLTAGVHQNHRMVLPSLSSAPSLSDSLTERRRSSAASVMMATPERIELENCRKEELQEKPEEVSEEVLNRFNLSVDEDVRVSSEEEEGEEGPGCVSSQEATSAWRETLLPLRGEEEEEREENESSDEGEYSPWEMERRSGLWLLLEEESELEFSPHTPVQRGSASSLQPCISCSPSPSITPPTAPTPSTASFVTSPDSTPDSDIAKAPLSPDIVMETTAQKGPTAGGQGSFDDITPELPQKKALLQQEDSKVQTEEEMSDGVMMRRRHREAQSLPPSLLLPSGCGAFLLHLKEKLREAPPPGQVEFGEGGARGLLKAVIPGNRKDQKRRGGTLPAEKPRKLPANQRRVPGDDAIRNRVMSHLSMRETMFQKEQEDEDEDLDTKITRRVQRAARRQAKKDQLKRLHKAQVLAHQSRGDRVHGGSMSDKHANGFFSVLLKGKNFPSGPTETERWSTGVLQTPGLMKCQELLVQSNYLKSGRVNFILPCSVAIFSARGTASSHLERTHSLSHLEAQQPISRKLHQEGGRAISKPMSVSYLKRISELVEALRL